MGKLLANITPFELGDELFKIHTHAEIVYHQDPDQIVYREKDVVALLMKLGFPEPVFDYKPRTDERPTNKQG